jgi:hypothetical protein
MRSAPLRSFLTLGLTAFPLGLASPYNGIMQSSRTFQRYSAFQKSRIPSISPPPFQWCSKNKAGMMVLQNPVLAAGSFTHSSVPHPFRSASCTALLPHFFMSFIPPASAPRSKSPAFAPLHKSRPIPFRALVIYLSNSIQNCICNPVLLSFTYYLLPSISGKFLKSLHSIHLVCSVPQSHRISFSPSHNFTNALFSLPYC